MEDNIASVEKILTALDFREKTTILAVNKEDLGTAGGPLQRGWFRISARTGKGSGELIRAMVGVRKLFCQIAVRRLGYSGAAVARFLGVTTSLVNRYASSEGVGNLGQYL